MLNGMCRGGLRRRGQADGLARRTLTFAAGDDGSGLHIPTTNDGIEPGTERRFPEQHLEHRPISVGAPFLVERLDAGDLLVAFRTRPSDDIERRDPPDDVAHTTDEWRSAAVTSGSAAIFRYHARSSGCGARLLP